MIDKSLCDIEESKIKVFQKQPNMFIPHVEVSAMYLTINDEILLLQRSGSERGMWGVPAGKIEKGETPLQAMIRELFEETEINIHDDQKVFSLGKLYMQKPNLEYIYHMFHLNYPTKPQVSITDEHLDYSWYSLNDIEHLPLMLGALEPLLYFQKWLSNNNKLQ